VGSRRHGALPGNGPQRGIGASGVSRVHRVLAVGVCLVALGGAGAVVVWNGGRAPAAQSHPKEITPGTPAARADPTTPGTPTPRCPAGGVSLNIPWAVGGPRIEPDGRLVLFPGDWPEQRVDGLRLWDTRTAWLNLEPVDDGWEFAHLDALVAKAEGRGVTRITLVLAGTPRWAATRVSDADAPWLGPGSAAPPRDIAQWQEFTATVAERYRGRIDAYEVWNEPLSAEFFNGTPEEWALLVATAAAEIRRQDPAADILASGFVLNSAADLADLGPWLSALAGSGAVQLGLTGLSVHWYPSSWAQLADRHLGLPPARRDRRAHQQRRHPRAGPRRSRPPGKLLLAPSCYDCDSATLLLSQTNAVASLEYAVDMQGGWNDLVAPQVCARGPWQRNRLLP